MIAKTFAKIADLMSVATTHNVGIRKIFLTKEDTLTNMTQFAYGELGPDESVETHIHPTMEEFFFFTSGSGFYKVGADSLKIEKDVFVRIPANTAHSLHNTTDQQLQFIYFGIAI